VIHVKKELLISLLAVLIALVAGVGIWNRSATVAFANDTESDSAISSIDSMAYNADTRDWTIHQLASSKLTPNP
jgi:hypothetical protein